VENKYDWTMDDSLRLMRSASVGATLDGKPLYDPETLETLRKHGEITKERKRQSTIKRVNRVKELLSTLIDISRELEFDFDDEEFWGCGDPSCCGSPSKYYGEEAEALDEFIANLYIKLSDEMAEVNE